MEILLCIIAIILIHKRKVIAGSVKIEKLPIGKNPKGYFEETAFTEVYYRLKK